MDPLFEIEIERPTLRIAGRPGVADVYPLEA